MFIRLTHNSQKSVFRLNPNFNKCLPAAAPLGADAHKSKVKNDSQTGDRHVSEMSTAP